jgi:hypothetical protein
VTAADGVTSSLTDVPEPSLSQICAELRAEPMFAMSLGSKELFHSNLLGWLATEHSDAVASALAPWLEPNPQRSVLRVRSEFHHLDLALELPGYEPLVIENKMFSVPRPEQLETYSKRIERDRTLGPATVKLLLSPLRPAWSMDGWQHVSYNELCARLRAERFDDGYVEETVARWAQMAIRISTILERAADVTALDGPWLFPDPERTLAQSRIAAGCSKLRADAVSAELKRRIGEDGITGVYVKSGLTNTLPFVEIFQDTTGDRVGWQLRAADWRLAAVFPSLWGRTKELRSAGQDRAEQLTDWFDFTAVTRVVPGARPTLRGADTWNRYDPDFVYRYYRVADITIGQILELGIAYARAAEEHPAI